MSSHYQKDYIMRIIEQFTQALCGIIKKREEGKYEESFQQICSASTKFLKLNFEDILKLEPNEILENFKDEPLLITFCADMLREMALICEAKQYIKEYVQIKAKYSAIMQNLNPEYVLNVPEDFLEYHIKTPNFPIL